MIHLPAGCLPVIDPIPTGHLPDFRRRPREERPAREVCPVRLGIALEDCRRVPLRIYRDREKEDLWPEISAEGCLQTGHLGGQEWTGIGAGGVDKGHGHDLPTQLREGESLAVLGHQAQLRRWPNPRQAVTLSGSVTQ